MSILPLGKAEIDFQILALSSGDISASAQLQFDHPVISDNNGFISVTAKAYDLPSGDILVPTDFGTIQLALDIIPSSVEKTVVVEPGEYFENIMLRRINNVTIRSQSGPLQTIINGGGSGMVIDSDHENRAGGITFDGFTITGGVGGAIDVYHTDNNITLKNLIEKDNHGVSSSTSRFIITVTPKNTILENVVISDNQHNQSNISQDWDSALSISGSADFGNITKIINCTIVNNDELSGLKVQNWGGEASIVMFNSVIWGNAQNIIIHSNGSPYVYIDQSMIYDAPSIMDAGSAGTLTLNNCIDQYPYFNNP